MSNLLLVHGAWGGPWEFQEVIDGLSKRGHRAHAVELPGHGQSTTPIAEVTMEAYVQCVIDAAKAIEGPVVLVGHSLSGAVISQVAERIPEKIERLVFAAAILPKNGQTPLSIMQSDNAGELLARVEFSDDGSYLTVGPEVVKEVMLHDVTEPHRLNSFLPHFAMKQAAEPFMFASELSEKAFGSVPKTYIRATLDKVLSPALQDQMISNWDVDQVITLESGHFPLMSVPDRLIEALGQAVNATVSTRQS